MLFRSSMRDPEDPDKLITVVVSGATDNHVRYWQLNGDLSQVAAQMDSLYQGFRCLAVKDNCLAIATNDGVFYGVHNHNLLETQIMPHGLIAAETMVIDTISVLGDKKLLVGAKEKNDNTTKVPFGFNDKGIEFPCHHEAIISIIATHPVKEHVFVTCGTDGDRENAVRGEIGRAHV